MNSQDNSLTENLNLSNRPTARNQSPDISKDENISLTFNESAFTSESCKNRALQLKREREEEIRHIRAKSAAFEAKIREKVSKIKDQAALATQNDKHKNKQLKLYEKEFTKFDDSISNILETESPKDAMNGQLTPKNNVFQFPPKSTSPSPRKKVPNVFQFPSRSCTASPKAESS